jgi:hypothetical protein
MIGLVRDLRRRARPAGKTVQAIARWKRLSFNEAPAIFGNAKPKSGSHLLLQVLAGLTRVAPYAYVEADPVRTITKEGRRRQPEEVRAELSRIPQGVIGWGYVEPSPENISFLCRPGRVNFFVYRDPRDMLVSHVFFATDLYEEHGMHAFYKSLPDFDARLKVAITGVEGAGLKMVSVRQRYEGVLKWLEQEHVLCLRFEDLVNQPQATLGAVLDELEKTGYRIPTPRPQALAVLANAIRPERSRTFRAGKTGTWREYFSPDHKRLFLEVAGDLLVELAYENGSDW